MKKLMKVETNASTMFVSYDVVAKVVRVLDNEETNGGLDLREVEDDSSWTVYHNVDDIESFLGINDTPDSPVITDTITFGFTRVIVYGYYNYANTHDHKEHYTLTPKFTIDNSCERDYSGNRYVYDVDLSPLDLVYSVEEEDGYTVDYFYDRRLGGSQWAVIDDKGCLYLVPADRRLWGDHDNRIKLGMLYKHKVEE